MVGIKSSLLNNSWSDYTVWQGESITKKTPEEYGGKEVIITDDFRVYDTPERSFCDFLLFLKYASNEGKGGKPKYGDEVLEIKNPDKLIKTVASRGYATSKAYPTSVMKIVKKHKLTKYDDLAGVEPTEYVPGKKEKEDPKTPEVTRKLPDREIKDITAENRSEVPASRGSNPIKFIVVHYLGVPNRDNPYLYGGGYGGHYNITRDGTVYKAADPKTAVVWHCGGGLQGDGGHPFYKICTNYNSIGIECGVNYTDTSARDGDGDSNKWYFTEATQESLVWLVSKLMDEYKIPLEHVIRHYDVTSKNCPNPYVKNNKLKTSWTWDEFKANLVQYRKDGTIKLPTEKRGEITKEPVTLRIGNSGEAVKELQNMLIALGYSCGSYGADGKFGSATQNALKAFQKASGLAVDGIYGEHSRAALTSAYKATAASTDNKQQSNNADTKVPTPAKYSIGGIDYSPVFNPTYYLNSYPDLKAAFGSDEAKAFNHFVNYGRKEARKASKNFNPRVYRTRYADLNKAFGNNWPAYYEHYLKYGIKENRNGK